MRMYDLIMKKRKGEELTTEEINFFVDGFTKGEIPDYQASAMLMAIFFNKMNKRETADLTNAMVESGDKINLKTKSYRYPEKRRADPSLCKRTGRPEQRDRFLHRKESKAKRSQCILPSVRQHHPGRCPDEGSPADAFRTDRKQMAEACHLRGTSQCGERKYTGRLHERPVRYLPANAYQYGRGR